MAILHPPGLLSDLSITCLMKRRHFSEIQLLNGSTGDPVLFIDYPGKNDALLFDAGDLGRLDIAQLRDLAAVFITHHHMDHFVGFDRVLRASLNSDKTVHVFGPETTIDKIYQRIKSYEIAHFPFQRLVMAVTEILPDRLRSAELVCARRFPPPTIEERPREGIRIYDDGNLAVEAIAVDHTVPCLAYALVERDGLHPDRDRLQAGPLRAGPWINQVFDAVLAGQEPDHLIEVAGGRFHLGELIDHYFVHSRGARIAFVTDTAWSEAVQTPLLRLAKNAQRLYCDCFYAAREAKKAAQYHHMTTDNVGEFAAQARVEELVLIHFSERYAGRYQKLVDEVRKHFPKTSAEF